MSYNLEEIKGFRENFDQQLNGKKFVKTTVSTSVTARSVNYLSNDNLSF